MLKARSRLEAVIDQTRRQLATNDAAAVLADLPSAADALRERWDAEPMLWRRKLVAAVVDRVTITPAVRGRNFFDPDRVTVTWRA
jgi:uncharacterized protein (DUF2267 family)